MAVLARPSAVEVTSSSNLGSLPDDLLHSILGRFSELSRGYSHALVCRRWAALAPSAQLSCAIVSGDAEKSDFDSEEDSSESGEEQGGGCKDFFQISQELSLFPSLTSLGIATSRLLEESFLTSVSSSLQHLWLKGDHYRVAPEGLARFRSLSTLCIPKYAICEWPLPASLRHLDAIISEEGLQRISELRELRVLKTRIPHDAIALPESMSQLTNLEELDLDGFELQSLFSGIGHCRKLRRLTVDCFCTLHLPATLTQLSCLSYMYLKAYRVIPPRGMEALTSLRTIKCLSKLSEDGAQALLAVPSLQQMTTPRLPSDMSMLASLRELDVFGGDGSHPESMWALGKLRVLRLKWPCHGLRAIPESIWGLSCLEELEIRSCQREGHQVESLPDSLGLLTYLRKVVLRNIGVRYLPESVGGLSRLEELRIERCRRLKSLPDSLTRLPHLRKVFLEDTGLRYLPKSISGLSRLEELTIRECHDMKSLPDSLALLPNLRKLVLDDNDKLHHFPPFADGAWPSLQSIHLQDLPRLKISKMRMGMGFESKVLARDVGTMRHLCVVM